MGIYFSLDNYDLIEFMPDLTDVYFHFPKKVCQDRSLRQNSYISLEKKKKKEKEKERRR